MKGSNIFQDDTKVSETYDGFFSDAVKHLSIVVQSEFSQKNINATTDPVRHAILRHEDQPSIIKRKDIAGDANYFCFKHASMFDIQN